MRLNTHPLCFVHVYAYLLMLSSIRGGIVPGLVSEVWLHKGKKVVSSAPQARHRVTGDIITLKKLRMDREEDGVPSHIIREVAVLKELDHPNIVR